LSHRKRQVGVTFTMGERKRKGPPPHRGSNESNKSTFFPRGGGREPRWGEGLDDNLWAITKRSDVLWEQNHCPCQLGVGEGKINFSNLQEKEGGFRMVLNDQTLRKLRVKEKGVFDLSHSFGGEPNFHIRRGILILNGSFSSSSRLRKKRGKKIAREFIYIYQKIKR